MGSFGNMSQMYNTEPIRFQTLGSIGIKLSLEITQETLRDG